MGYAVLRETLQPREIAGALVIIDGRVFNRWTKDKPR